MKGVSSMAEWSKAQYHIFMKCSVEGSSPPWTFYHLNFLSNFYQTFRANSSFSKVFESKRTFPPKGQYHKEHFKLGPMYVLKCALSEK